MTASEALLPGEDPATGSASDIEFWLETYTRLIARCRQRGFGHRRFESRLAYWQRRHLADVPAAEVHLHASSSTPLRCPFSTMGLDSDVMSACPGFEAETVTFANLTEETSVTGMSCRHITVHRTALGFAAFCGLPERVTVGASDVSSRASEPTADNAA